jgi:outer membrane protein assembly factor BamB
VCLCPRWVNSAVNWVVAPPGTTIAASDKDESKRPFRLIAQSTDNTEAWQDFDRHRQRGTWERAFKALEKAKASNPNALVPRDDDFYIPSRMYTRQLLASLPQAGKDAYRIFNDPEAKKLLDAAQGKDEASQLADLVEQYFLSSVTDVAADRLGDLEFERGDVEQAADRWLSVLRYRPESSLSRAQLLTKAGIALIRAGRTDEARGIARQLRERYAQDTVLLGGREVNALAHLTAVLAGPSGAKQDQQDISSADLSFAADGHALWRFQILSPASAKQLAEANNGWMWNGSMIPTDLVPPTATDGARVYVNYVGYGFALDLKTGKLVWRTAKFHDVVQKMRQNHRLLPEHFGICTAADRVFFVARDPAKMNEQNQPFLLSCRETATGKEVWSSDKVETLKTWHIWGSPTASGDRVYVSALQAGKNRDLHVLAIQASDGKLLWSTHCGTYQADESQLYNQRASKPALVLQGERLYIDTHIGSLLLIDTKSGATLWGFNYDADPPSTDYWWGEPRPLLTAGPPIISDDMLFVKGMRSSRLCAVQLSGPSVAFKRAVGTPAILIGGDEDRLYLGGDEIIAIDRKTQKLLWATKVPIATDYTRPIMTAGRLYQFTPRGIFEIDKLTGDVIKRHRGSDLDSLGGTLRIEGSTLVSVSNLAVTAYALSGERAAAPAGAAGQ